MGSGVKANGGHAGSPGGADAAGTVFDHDAVGGLCIEAFSGEQENIGRGLAVCHQFGAVDMGAEIFSQVQCFQAQRQAVGRTVRSDVVGLRRELADGGAGAGDVPEFGFEAAMDVRLERVAEIFG